MSPGGRGEAELAKTGRTQSVEERRGAGRPSWTATLPREVNNGDEHSLNVSNVGRGRQASCGD